MSNRLETHPDTPPGDEDRESRQQKDLINALLDGHRYPHRVKNVRLFETHISWVLLAGHYAYKIKKSVDLGFLDFTGLPSRRHYCEEEIRLNRRLAPQLYLDVIPIGGTPELPELGAQPAIEYAVRMRRFPVSKQLDRLAARGRIIPQHMDNLAATIAHFHSNLPPAEARSKFGSVGTLRSAVFRSFDRLQASLSDREDEASVIALRNAMETEYAGCKERFEQRHAQGFVRECHGDLHLGNIVLIDEQPIPFDCIEFDPALRWIDVMNEVAFTVMDLLYYQRPELAYRFLNAYLENTGDYTGVPLLRFYIAYRATVRAMVSAIRAGQPGVSSQTEAEAWVSCRSFIALAAEQLKPVHGRPALIITHGLPGSGKTTFAQAAVERFQAMRIRSDVERKRLFGLTPLADSGLHESGIYHAEATMQTYARLRELARELLAAGFPVIVDAAFLKQEERAHFRLLTDELAVPFAIASLKAAPATMRSRIIKRQSESSDASEADPGVLKLLQEKEEVLTPKELACSVEFVNEKEGFDGDDSAWKKLDRLLAG